MNEIIDILINHLVSEKEDCKEYRELAEKVQDEGLRNMLMVMANQEHDHYEMVKQYIMNKVQ